MKTEKIVSIILMLLGIIFFGIYIWWITNYFKTQVSYAFGILFTAAGTFLTGAVTFFVNNDK
jgi:hypothetical protein